MRKALDLSKMTAAEQVEVVTEVSDPEFAQHAKWSEFTPEQWLLLLGDSPAVARHCDWEKAGLAHYSAWHTLLARRPKHIAHCPQALIASWPAEDWIKLVTKHFHLASYFPIKSLEPIMQDSLLYKHPVFSRIISNDLDDPLMFVYCTQIDINPNDKDDIMALRLALGMSDEVFPHLSFSERKILIQSALKTKVTPIAILPKSRVEKMQFEALRWTPLLFLHIKMRPYEQTSYFFPQTQLEEAIVRNQNVEAVLQIHDYEARLSRPDVLAEPEVLDLNIRTAMLLIEMGIPDDRRQDFVEQLRRMRSCNPEVMELLEASLKAMPDVADLSSNEKELLKIIAAEDSVAVSEIFDCIKDLYLSWLPLEYYRHLGGLNKQALVLLWNHLGFRLQPCVIKNLYANRYLLSLSEEKHCELITIFINVMINLKGAIAKKDNVWE